MEVETHLECLHSYGIATTRYLSGIPVDGEISQIDVPLGSFIVRWDLARRERTFSIHSGCDLITCMMRNPVHPISCTVTHRGDVVLWKYPEWTRLSSIRVPTRKIMHAAFSPNGEKLVLAGQFYGGKICALDLSADGLHLSLVSEYGGIYDCVEISNEGIIFAVEKEDRDNARVKVVSIRDGVVQRETFLAGRGATCSSFHSVSSLIAIAKVDHEVVVMNTQTLDIVFRIPHFSKTFVRSIIFDGDHDLLAMTSAGTLSHYKRDQLYRTYEIPDCIVYYLQWVVPHEKLWISGENGLHYVSVVDGERHDLTYHEITCCGVDSRGDFTCAGDLLGHVILWRGSDAHPLARSQLPAGVRSVTFGPGEDISLQIGCVDGQIWNWRPLDSEEPKLLFLLLDTVTCLRWERGEGSDTLMASTTDGTVALLRKVPGHVTMAACLVIKAHQPIVGPQDLRFGSIQKYAEIWSCSWSPDGSMFATSSEDQTTHIWNRNGEKLATLSGHTAAVTSVDWTDTVIGQIIATCADDQTIRIYETKDWNLLHVFTTEDIEEWHTLTYLCIEPSGDRLAVASQNGYVCVWSLETKERLFAEKMHAGSIEGLCWERDGHLRSCSSDCTVNVYRVGIKK
ncbi:hypothetical protein PROFUN_02870 [Planoprotostelium fungivorum]|uniref:Uncharacterized protein n=1 Tax=Planoprotostelium fungivorum TaxID=1890364 RepID=A0A2P6NRZ4_9EUKA|nr:hypothetical protein PROFUN_02870 [Planoprotostelium fungivorum]